MVSARWRRRRLLLDKVNTAVARSPRAPLRCAGQAVMRVLSERRLRPTRRLLLALFDAFQAGASWKRPDATERVRPLVGRVGGHKATECKDCLALAVAAYELAIDDLCGVPDGTCDEGH